MASVQPPKGVKLGSMPDPVGRDDGSIDKRYYQGMYVGDLTVTDYNLRVAEIDRNFFRKIAEISMATFWARRSLGGAWSAAMRAGQQHE